MKPSCKRICIYVVLCIVFFALRINNIIHSGGLYDIEFKTIAVANSFFPFEIIIKSATDELNMPLYYLILRVFTSISQNEIFLHFINTIFQILSIFFAIRIGRKLVSFNFGFFVALFLILNKYFTFYTGLISPTALSFLCYLLTINYFLDFIKKPNLTNSKRLIFANLMCIFSDTFGCIFVGIQIYIIYLISKKKDNIRTYYKNILNLSFIYFLIASPLLILQFVSQVHFMIPESTQAIGFNFNGLYLLINEFISPFLSFISPDEQAKSTLGMIQTFFLNPKLTNLNSLKIFITLFYSSILPLIFLIFCLVNTVKKNYGLKVIFYNAFLYFISVIFLSIIGFLSLNPVNLAPFFIMILIVLCYQIYLIKDKVLKYLLICSFVAIQLINPNVNSFNVAIEKKYPVNKCIDKFLKEYEITNNDFIFMPYLGNYGKFYYKKLKFFTYDESMLKKYGKDRLLNYLTNSSVKSKKKNFKSAFDNYLSARNSYDFLTRYFVDNCTDKTNHGDRIIFIADKLNSKPVSKNAIDNYLQVDEYKPKLRRIYFRKNKLIASDYKYLFDSVSSRVFYDFLTLFSESFYTIDIVEYKKIGNEYYKVVGTNKKDIIKAIMSNESDFVFIIFQRANIKSQSA